MMGVTVVVQGGLKKVQELLALPSVYGGSFEFRLDLMDEDALKALPTLRSQVSLPVIFTLRGSAHGGRFLGSKQEREECLFSSLALNPTYVDLEDDSDPSFFAKVKERYPQIKIIISHHDFEKTPQDLEGLLAAMQLRPAAIFKIACMARSSLDALLMLIFVQEKRAHRVPLAGMCMGPLGRITRILAPVVGSLLTYAPRQKGEESAPEQNSLGQSLLGQVAYSELFDLYHFHKLNRHTAIYALIGDPVDHSIGHLFHNFFLRVLKHNGVYVKIPLKQAEILSFFSLMKKLPFRGCSVTMPLKEEVGPFLAHVEKEARQIGAINTLAFQKGKWVGYNTDGKGALDVIEKRGKVRKKTVVILGAGGAAKGVGFEAMQRGARVVIVNRTKSKGKRLGEQVQGRGYGFESLPQIKKEGYDVLINTTSVGMAPLFANLPLDPDFFIRGSVVLDMVLYPRETTFLKMAKEKGCELIYGDEMYAQQGLRQLEIWLKKPLVICALKDKCIWL